MQCEFCDSHITDYPSNGICPHCGARLPQKKVPPVPPQSASVTPPPVTAPLILGVNCCPQCGNAAVEVTKRGFRWGLALIWFCILPPYGLLFGFWGSKKEIHRCTHCGHKWK